MKLALVIYSIRCGGAERVLVTMANYWAAKGWNIHLLTFDDGSQSPFYPLDPRIQDWPLNVQTQSKTRGKAYYENARRLWGIRRSLQRIKPDAVISFMDTTNIFTIVAARSLRIPVIVSERTDPRFVDIGSWDTLRKLIYPLANALVVQTEKVKYYFSPRVQKKCVIIPNPVLTPPETSPDPSIVVMRPSILSLGRLVKDKGFDILIRAFLKVHQENSEWSLTLFGEGPLRKDLENLINNLGLTQSVFLPGQVQNQYAILRQADLYVLSSRFEGFPNALCEAMACGLPVISTNCPSGPAAIIRDQVDGLLVENENEDALALAVNRLIQNPEERQKLASRALEIVERFGLEKVMIQWEEIIAKSDRSQTNKDTVTGKVL